MKHLFIAAILLFTFAESMSQNNPCGTTPKHILGGENGSIFQAEFNTYVPKMDFLLKTDFDGVLIKVILGDWCEDSQREVPRFMRISEVIPKSMLQIEYFLVDRDKYCADPAVQELKVPYVPTFIFYRNGAEIGRIVETPEKSLEEDMLLILGSSDR